MQSYRLFLGLRVGQDVELSIVPWVKGRLGCSAIDISLGQE